VGWPGTIAYGTEFSCQNWIPRLILTAFPYRPFPTDTGKGPVHRALFFSRALGGKMRGILWLLGVPLVVIISCISLTFSSPAMARAGSQPHKA
jgi:hypothetical protein